MFPDSTVAIQPRGRSAMLSDLRGLKDDQLLARFFESHEDSAFSVLVERYGPLVYGVCRRILADSNDAEDAFQATFLVLVRKGGSLRDPGRLASWLYGVAYRTARKARAKAALRTKSERQAGEMPTKSAGHEMTYDELQALLDEEISQLPEKYALPLVLCYLEGKTNAQAAAQLGWPEGIDLPASVARSRTAQVAFGPPWPRPLRRSDHRRVCPTGLGCRSQRAAGCHGSRRIACCRGRGTARCRLASDG
jgi:RNA polymerase sigma factor (sigma-70 family)